MRLWHFYFLAASLLFTSCSTRLNSTEAETTSSTAITNRHVIESSRFGLASKTLDGFAAGWQALGVCTPSNDLTGTNRDSVLAHLEMLRRHNLNTVRETASADGRIVARGTGRSWYNWYGYTFTDADGTPSKTGHPRPGAFVEGMLWMLDAAHENGDDDRISLIVGLPAFVTPGYEGTPHDGSEELSCASYQGFIEDEIRMNPEGVRESIPHVDCQEAPARMPFWEWNVWYVVHNLSAHPGLRAWYLWDEPEGHTYRHLFGTSRGAPPRFTGPSSMPTTDLLRYAYRLVKSFDQGDHPILVDIHSPHVFFSERFAWSEQPDPRWSSGPFDVAPSGAPDTPADILGLEASSNMVHARSAPGMGAREWYWDPNFVSVASAMLAEVSERDEKKAMVIAAQAQLPSEGPFAAEAPLRCEPNDQIRTRILNDKDLTWQLLTTHINGMYGYVYYSHVLLPSTGPGAVQAERSSRLLDQFLGAQLDQIFSQPDESERISSVDVDVLALTDYHRNSPAKVGRLLDFEPALSPLSTRASLSKSDYRLGLFNRSASSPDYAAAVMKENRFTVMPDHELLRMTLRSWGDSSYLVVSNVYDARITVIIRAGISAGRMEEGVFDLEPQGTFRWTTAADLEVTSESDGALRLRIQLEPYEARIFRLD